MELVGAHQMADGAQTIHFGAQIRGQLDRRPDPQIAVLQSGNGRTRRIGKAKEADNLSLRDPKRVMHLLEHSSPLCREWLMAWPFLTAAFIEAHIRSIVFHRSKLNSQVRDAMFFLRSAFVPNSIAIDNDLRATLRNFGLKVGTRPPTCRTKGISMGATPLILRFRRKLKSDLQSVLAKWPCLPADSQLPAAR